MKHFVAPISVVTLGILLAGCATQNVSTPVPSPSPVPPSYTMAEVAKHATKEDCWMVINNVVYDVTSYIPDHPTPTIDKGCGKEATAMFEKIKKHEGRATEMLSEYDIGTLKTE